MIIVKFNRASSNVPSISSESTDEAFISLDAADEFQRMLKEAREKARARAFNADQNRQGQPSLTNIPKEEQ
jgi:hypothetical protein